MIFLSLLLFASCLSLKTSINNELVQISSNPEGEGVFALLAVHLKQDNSGFEKIYALLTELVDDARSQLHENNLVGKATEAACHVSTYKLNERQEFFDGLVDSIRQAKKDAAQQNTEIQLLIDSRNNNAKVYTQAAADTEERGKSGAQYATDSDKALQDGIDATNNAIDAVESWTPETKPEFIQAKINRVTESYLKATHFKMTVPSTFVQLAGRDEKVRNRLLEWLGDLKVELTAAQQDVHETAKHLGEDLVNLHKDLSDLANDLEASAKSLGETAKHTAAVAKAVAKGFDDFKNMASENMGLIKANGEWCRVELGNYRKATTTVEGQIKLFKEVRNYFVNHYQEISRYIQEKYH